MDDIFGSFRVQFGDVVREKVHHEAGIEYAIRELVHKDPDIANQITALEQSIAAKLKVTSDKTGRTFTPTFFISDTYYAQYSHLPLRFRNLRETMLNVVSRKDENYEPRMLGPIHMGLLELDLAGGQKKCQEMIEPQWRRALFGARRRRSRQSTKIDLNKLIICQYIKRDDQTITLAEAGKEFLNAKKKAKPTRINSPELKRAFFLYAAAPKAAVDLNTTFYLLVLEQYGFLERKGETLVPTKGGQRYLERSLAQFLLRQHQWRPTHSGWASHLQLDHALVNMVPGVGATLLSKTDGRLREYLKLLLSTTKDGLQTVKIDPYS